MAWTDPDDVTDAWIGEGAPTDLSLIQVWIDKAEREVTYRVPDLLVRIGTGDFDLQIVKDVVVAMVTRVFRNPEGIRQRSSTAGPFTEAATYGGNTPGLLALTDEELTKLQARTPGAFTIDMIPATSPFSPLYVNPLGL
jgi:hypothetical protein